MRLRWNKLLGLLLVVVVCTTQASCVRYMPFDVPGDSGVDLDGSLSPSLDGPADASAKDLTGSIDGSAVQRDSLALGDAVVCDDAGYCPRGFALRNVHPSGVLASTQNRIELVELLQEPLSGKWSSVLVEDMGSFTGQPQWWDVWYSYDNPPPHCMDRYSLHEGTPFEGLRDKYFPAESASGLVQKLRDALNAPYTYRAASNTAGGDLCQPGNFWTQVKVFAAGADHVEAVLNAY